MSAIDVCDLASDPLPESSFPASPRADFRVYLSPEVHRGTWEHAKQDVSFEICGVLVGRWGKDDNGPYAVVTDYIQCDTAASKSAEVTFTHESWSQINQEMDSKFSDQRIVGWYHSHPDFGIFLSDRDCFIHEHFFENPGQVAYVIDPVRNTEGMFAWRQGKPTSLAHYWIGNSIQTEGSQGKLVEDTPEAGVQTSTPAQSERHWLADITTMLLLGLVMFMLGQFLARQSMRWERQMIEQGAVAHYGINKVMKVGLEKDLAAVDQQMELILQSFEKLPAPGDDLTEEEFGAASALHGDIGDSIEACRIALSGIGVQYALTAQERELLMLLVLQKQAELQKQLQQPKNNDKQPITKNASVDSDNGDSTPTTNSTKSETDNAEEVPADSPEAESPSQAE